MALLAWNPKGVSKIHDHPLACFESHLAGPPLQEVHYAHPNHATVAELHAASSKHPDNPNRWVVSEENLVVSGSGQIGEGEVAFDTGSESLHTLGNPHPEDVTFSMHTYIGAYDYGAPQSYVFNT